MSGHFDCIVIGAGAVGTAAAYHLATRGHKVVALDPHPPGHDKGSSHGDTRIIRLVYFEHPDYVPLLKRAFTLWQELDDRSDTALFTQTGILQSGPREGKVIAGMRQAAETYGLLIEPLTATDVANTYPGFHLRDGDEALFDPNGGILAVEDCVRSHADFATAAGASINVGERAMQWQEKDGQVQVVTEAGNYTADRLIVSPGAWAPGLLPATRRYIHLLRKSLFWFDASDDTYDLNRGSPVFLFEHGPHAFYGFPVIDDKGIKVADHQNGLPLAVPEQLDRHVDPDELEAASLFLRNHLPRAGHQLNHHTTCMYTMSDDGHFIVDRYPGTDHVYFAAGLSGHGFKFATILGEVLADLAIDGRTEHPIDFLSISRFLGHS